MSVAKQTQTSSVPGSQVANLREKPKGESLWADAFRRLLRNKAAVLGGIVIILNVLIAIFASSIAPYDYKTQERSVANSAPLWVTRIFPNMVPKEDGGYVTITEKYPLGADALGRDLFTRILYGARVSLSVAFVGPFVSIIAGMLVGMCAGYVGGKVDNVLMRIVDVMYAFPTFLFIILLMAFFRASFVNVERGTFAYTISELDSSTGGMLFIFIGIGLTSWMQMARLVRGQVLSVREKEYIEAAKSIGTKTPAIMWQHILPNILGPIIVAETLAIPQYISYEAFLSFIGLGVNPPMPSWGAMISEGAQVISTYPYQALFPALALFFTMFAFNFLGDGLRDALDPRMRGTD